ncbi:hypothetical protein MACH26_38740 [Planctobacterium marinum]|uniref:DUF2798 domain-containing protein n=1 Tax=Planctobacterium marinum TaxID=1631968 RepID=A0AA48HYV1_9ALTE|nr:hypothetical protein MACH26_38740 [Planctobacterium marinum]
MALVVTLKLYDGNQSLFFTWFNSWLSSWVISYPCLLVVIPLVKRIVAWVTHPAKSE